MKKRQVLIPLTLLTFLIILNGYLNEMKIEQTSLYLNTPLANPINLKLLDGRKIETTIQYQMLINMNLTLLEYDKNSNLVTLLAENFDVEDNKITLEIRKGVRTISGHEIKAMDAEMSLKRLMLIKSGSHSKLEDLICEGHITSITGGCSGITSNGYILTISALKKSYVPFILSLLTNADNVILPLTAIDMTDKDLPIKTFKETSGPYFIDNESISDNDLDQLALVPNKENFLYSPDMPQKINYSLAKRSTLVNTDGTLKKQYNYISNIYSLNDDTLKQLQGHDSSIRFYPTSPLKNKMIFTTEFGRKNNHIKDLLGACLFIRDRILKSTKDILDINLPQIEYFSSGSDGQLSMEQLRMVESLYKESKIESITSERKVRIGVFSSVFEEYQQEFMNVKSIEIVKISSIPNDKTENIDFFIATVDSSFTESLDLLQYNKTFGIFDVSDEEMRRYIDSESKNDRIKLLQDIHFKSLMNARFVNIEAAPYYTILSKDWTAEPPRLFVGFPAWKIRKKN